MIAAICAGVPDQQDPNGLSALVLPVAIRWHEVNLPANTIVNATLFKGRLLVTLAQRRAR